MAGLDPGGLEVGDRQLAVGILADASDQPGMRAGSAGHDRLVGALAAEAQGEAIADHGLPGARDSRRVGDEIDVGAAYDRDHRCPLDRHGTSLLSR